jgi:hypothetical protein
MIQPPVSDGLKKKKKKEGKDCKHKHKKGQRRWERKELKMLR